VDTETTGLVPWKGDRPFAVSFCNEAGETGYVRWRVDPVTRLVVVNRGQWKRLKEWFADPKITRVWFNGPFDRRMLATFGIDVVGRNEEVMASMFLAKPDIEVNVALKPLAEKYLGIANDDEDELKVATQKIRKRVTEAKDFVRKRSAKVQERIDVDRKLGLHRWRLGPEYPADYHMAPPELLERYARLDAERTMMLWLLSSEWLRKNDQWDLYEQELRLLPITTSMVDRGVLVSKKNLRKCGKDYDRILADTLGQMRKLAGEDFDPGKSQQVAKYLYETSGMPVLKRTPTGRGSTDWTTLKDIKHPLVPLLNDHRVAAKAKASYLEPYEEDACWGAEGGYRFGVLHPGYIQFGPHTGRYACRRPSLQVTPGPGTSRTSLHSTVVIRARECIVPRKGYVFLMFDQSQVEPRVFADKAQEPSMLKSFQEGRSVHQDNCNRLWGSNVTRAMHLLRTDDYAQAQEWLFETWNHNMYEAEKSLGESITYGLTKAVLFLVIYGGGAKSLVELMQGTISFREAEDILDEFDRMFPGIRVATRGMEAFARSHGYIETAYGRRIVVDPGWLYRATNYYVQGTSADLLKRVMLQGVELARRKKWDVHLVLTLHDEIMWEWPVMLLHQSPILEMKKVLEDHGGVFPVDMPVEVEIARKSWGLPEPLGPLGIANLPR
jgi:DNA polymerase-1